VKEAWFFGEGKYRGYLDLLYLPYTSMVLSYVVIGAAIAPVMHFDRLAATLAAYFLGVGLSAHYLNEASTARAGTKISRRKLLAISLLALSGALFIGVYYALTVSLPLFVFVFVETFFLFSYNVRSFMWGRFHNDFWFSLSWGSLPVLTSYFVNALTITPSGLVMSVVAGLTAGIQARLSRWLKDWRRNPQLDDILFKFEGNQVPLSKKFDLNTLVWRPQSALKILVLAVNLLALSMILPRLAL